MPEGKTVRAARACAQRVDATEDQRVACVSAEGSLEHVRAFQERRETASALEEAYGEDVVVGNALKAVTNP